MQFLKFSRYYQLYYDLQALQRPINGDKASSALRSLKALSLRKAAFFHTGKLHSPVAEQ